MMIMLKIQMNKIILNIAGIKFETYWIDIFVSEITFYEIIELIKGRSLEGFQNSTFSADFGYPKFFY